MQEQTFQQQNAFIWVGTVRGYESYSLSPRDGQDRRIGGRNMFTNSLEASFPLVPKAKLRLTAFYDYGFLEGKAQELFTGDPLDTDALNAYLTDPTTYKTETISRSSYGAAIEWFSPMGPIQLIFSQAIDDEVGDQVSTFEFTIGQRF